MNIPQLNLQLFHSVSGDLSPSARQGPAFKRSKLTSRKYYDEASSLVAGSGRGTTGEGSSNPAGTIMSPTAIHYTTRSPRVLEDSLRTNAHVMFKGALDVPYSRSAAQENACV